MNRILTPTGGSVLIEDIPVSDYKLRNLAQILGYVPYSSKDSFPMTVMDTVLIGRNPRSDWRVSDKDLEIVVGALRMMGIEDLAMRVFNELSAGQRQKVMLARGLVQEPRALLLDEPTANLDIKHQYGVTKTLRSITREKDMLVIMICHDLNIAAKYADRIILMSEGTVFAVGSPSEVITEENIRKVYGVDCRILDDNGSPHVIVIDEV
jgi:iron complex transport system ATP-binding protein